MLPTYTPYDGSSKPFTIGLKPLDPSCWLEVDGHREAYLAEKRRLYATMPDKVFAAEEGTEAAQQEVLEMAAAHLREHFPDLKADAPPVQATAAEHPSSGLAAQPLHAASLLMQEDLVLMRRGDDGWRLAAASLCFPSAWSLAEKFGKPMSAIHEPVPGFGPGTRNAGLIDRMFDKLQVPQPVERMNWSLQAGPALYMPLSNNARNERATGKPSRFPEADAAANAFIRVERQTLRKLPRSGDVLFTIRIYIDPMKVLEGQPDRATLAASLAAQLEAMDDPQIDYKGLSADRARLVERLRAMV